MCGMLMTYELDFFIFAYQVHVGASDDVVVLLQEVFQPAYAKVLHILTNFIGNFFSSPVF